MSSKTRKGVKWSVADQVMKQSLILLTSAILARQITPEEFGYMGITLTFFIWFQNLADFGFEASIINKKDIREEELSSLFWTTAGTGFLFAFILFLCAPLISAFFKLPELGNLVRVASAGIWIGAFGIVPGALIQKRLQFKAFFIRHSVSYIIGGTIAVIMALKGYGVWALVAQHLIVCFLNVLVSFSLVRWKPILRFESRHISGHLKFILPFMGHSNVHYWIRHLDNILIGKFLNAHALGIYNRAYNLMSFPVNQIAGTLSRVAFPSMARYQDNRALIWDAFTGLLAAVASIAFPLMAIAGIYSWEIILILFGPQWEEATVIFRILCALGALQTLQSMAYPVYLSTGKTKTMFGISLVTYPFMLSGLLLGLYYGGLTGLAYGYLTGGIIGFHFELYILSKRFGKTLADCYAAFMKELTATMVLLAALFSFRKLVPIENISGGIISIHVIAGLLFTTVFIYLLKRFKSRGYEEVKKLILLNSSG